MNAAKLSKQIYCHEADTKLGILRSMAASLPYFFLIISFLKTCVGESTILTIDSLYFLPIQDCEFNCTLEWRCARMRAEYSGKTDYEISKDMRSSKRGSGNI